MSPAEKERYLTELENEFTGMSEKSVEELNQLAPLMDDEEDLEEFED